MVKNDDNCSKCKYDIYNDSCRLVSCTWCKNFGDTAHTCNCLTVEDGEECPYFVESGGTSDGKEQ